MTKNDCTRIVYAWTSKSNYSKQIKLYWGQRDDGQIFYFLGNGADCTKLVGTNEEGELTYQGGGWMENLLTNAIKGTSEDIEKLVKIIGYGAAVITTIILLVIYLSKKTKQ